MAKLKLAPLVDSDTLHQAGFRHTLHGTYKAPIGEFEEDLVATLVIDPKDNTLSLCVETNFMTTHGRNKNVFVVDGDEKRESMLCDDVDDFISNTSIYLDVLPVISRLIEHGILILS